MSLVGRSVGVFTVVEKMAEGVSAVVYRMEDASGRRRALKVLHPAFYDNRDIALRFRREAMLAGAIENEHLVEVFDTGFLDGRGAGGAYFTMEWLDGVRLSDVLATEPRFAWWRAVHIADGVARALAAVHAHGIIHRDLKPDNIFLVHARDDGDFVKLLDFGIAKLAVDEAQHGLTQDGMLFGTPQYMSPEQCRGELLDRRSDVYALGLVVYEMLAGRPAFDAANLGDLILLHLRQPPVDLRTIDPAIPECIAAAVHKALAKAPGDRFAKVEEFSVALMAAFEIEPVPEPVIETMPEPTTERFIDHFSSEETAFLQEMSIAADPIIRPSGTHRIVEDFERPRSRRRGSGAIVGAAALFACLLVASALIARNRSSQESPRLAGVEPAKGAPQLPSQPLQIVDKPLEIAEPEPELQPVTQPLAELLQSMEHRHVTSTHSSHAAIEVTKAGATPAVVAQRSPRAIGRSDIEASAPLGAHAGVVLRIIADVAGATLALDGERVGNPYTGTFSEGDWKHLVEVTVPGRAPLATWFSFDHDQLIRFDPATNSWK